MTRLLFALLILSLPAWAVWPNGYQYRRTITIDHTKVSTADQTGFPALVKISDAALKTVSNGGHVQNGNGFDIAFYSVSGGTALFWEVESYDGVNGVLCAWVNIPAVSHLSDTAFYLFYGKPGITSFQSSALSVWDSNFKVVYHLASNAGLSVVDSTGNSDLTANQGAPALGTGQISGAALFNGSSSFTSGSGSALNSSTMTMEAWINTSAAGYTGIANRDDYYSDRIFQFRVNSSNHLEFIPFPGGSPIALSGSRNVNDGRWHSVAATYDGTTISVYVDGTLDGAAQASGQLPSGTLPLYVGEINANNNFFTGTIDELRYSATSRSAGWIATSYNNQFNPSTFCLAGAEQTFTAITQSSFLIF